VCSETLGPVTVQLILRREDLAALPYLDSVIREVLRLWSPAPNTIRKATEAVVIPLSAPIEGRDGKMIESIALDKGTQLFIRMSTQFACLRSFSLTN
jgi:hypothetical protein